MRSRSRTLAAVAVLAAGTGFLGISLASTTAHAAQPYWCLCKGVKKRFLASTHKCEHDHHVKQCSAAQFRDFNRRACASSGCKPIR